MGGQLEQGSVRIGSKIRFTDRYRSPIPRFTRISGEHRVYFINRHRLVSTIYDTVENCETSSFRSMKLSNPVSGDA